MNDRLIEATERIDALERALLEAQDGVERKLSEARKPYADKIMALEAERDTARQERDKFRELFNLTRHDRRGRPNA